MYMALAAETAASRCPLPLRRRKKEKKRRSRSRSPSGAPHAAKRPRVAEAAQPPSSRMSAEELLAWEAAARLAAGEVDAAGAGESDDPAYDPNAYDWEGWLDN